MFDFALGLFGSACIALFSGGVFSTDVGCLAVGVLFVELGGSTSGALFDLISVYPDLVVLLYFQLVSFLLMLGV